MLFDWDFAAYSMMGGGALLMSAALTRLYEKSVYAPATAMLLTWGSALLVLSFLPLLGFYHLAVEAVLLYVLGALWFAFVAVLTTWVLIRYTGPVSISSVGAIDKINYKKLIAMWFIISIVAYPLAIINILGFGSDVTEISYNIRRATVAGEDILNPILSNLFVLLGILGSVVLYGVVKNKVNLLKFLVLVVPYVLISLIVYGRSGLVSLILGWLVIFTVFSERVRIRYILIPTFLMFFVLFFGGVWVKKFDIEGHSLGGILLVLMEHVFDYFYQGPILFSRYFTGEIDVATNWDFLNSACHLMAKIDLCLPLSQHQDFAEYGVGRTGNVYSIYFSIVPGYGLLGLSFVFLLYASFLAVLFHGMKAKGLFSLAVYPVMFAAVVLSVFTDSIGYSFYWLVKVAVVCIILRFLLSEKKSIRFLDSFRRRLIN